MSDPLLASYILLWFVVVATAAVALGTTRQVALLTRRFPFQQAVEEGGPALDKIVPPIEAVTRDGDRVRIGPEFRRRTAFVFVENGCTTCRQIAPDLEQTMADLADGDIWLVVDKDPGGDGDFDAFDGQVLVAPSAFDDWKIKTVPYACIVTEDGKLETKGQLLGVGRLREAFGLASGRAEGEEADR